MPALIASTVGFDLKPAKTTNSLAELGVPLAETTTVKKGKLGEFDQPLDNGKPGRRFQNIRATLVRALEGQVQTTRLIVELEVFGDDNVPATVNQGVAVALCSGERTLLELPLGTLFLPYACCWYENRFSASVPNELFDGCDRISFVAKADEVRAL